ncbi:MAG: hypothetical protein KDC58_08050 [Cyclobacteriaceae bacterium]|nr:hypothetical protein [Cyclobacteriaceae bacterium]
MKYSRIVVLLFLAGTLAVTGCKNKKVDEQTPKEKQTDLLAKTWSVKSDALSVTLDGSDEIDNWTGFSVNFEADGTYTASNVADGRDVVWPTSGTWDFKSDDELNTVIRGDDVSISIVVDEANLKMTFNYTANGGRTNGTDGVWVFNMQTN